MQGGSVASTNPDPNGIAAVRGAVPVRANRADDILAATARLLTALLDENGIAREQIVSALFTATDDLDADFPAHAARRLGWTDVPLLNAREIPVPGSIDRKSTRLNSSHLGISYAVFCLKKKTKNKTN